MTNSLYNSCHPPEMVMKPSRNGDETSEDGAQVPVIMAGYDDDDDDVELNVLLCRLTH